MNRPVFYLYASSGLILRIFAFGVAALAAHGLATWLGLRWYWQYLAVIIVWSVVNWGGAMFLDLIGRRITFPHQPFSN